MKNMKQSTKLKLYGFLVLFFALAFRLHAQASSVLYPESSLVRSGLIETWFTQDIPLLRDQSSEVFQNELGEYFLIRAEEKDNLMEIIVAPLVVQTLEIRDLSSLDRSTVQENTEVNPSALSIETWPKDGLGSWVLYRDITTGESVRIRYYFMNDKDIFVEFFPGDGKSFASFSIFDALVAYRVPVPVSLDYFYTASLRDVQKLTQNILPWQYTNVYDNVYADSIQMVREIRSLLPDAQRVKMFVSGNSEYDFLKWLVDGLVKPLTGGILYEEPLYKPTIEPNFVIPERQYTHKSYDFVRNLAAAALSADTSLPYTYDTSHADVKIEPFAVFTNENGINERVNFVTDVGYEAAFLKAVLYVLAATEGDLFYLGAIREVEGSSDLGKTAEQYYYNNAAAFFAWFDSQGKFTVSVFENGAEFTIDQFIERYPDSFVYLVRMKASLNFFPEIPEVDEDDSSLDVAR